MWNDGLLGYVCGSWAIISPTFGVHVIVLAGQLNTALTDLAVNDGFYYIGDCTTIALN